MHHLRKINYTLTIIKTALSMDCRALIRPTTEGYCNIISHRGNSAYRRKDLGFMKALEFILTRINKYGSIDM